MSPCTQVTAIFLGCKVFPTITSVITKVTWLHESNNTTTFLLCIHILHKVHWFISSWTNCRYMSLFPTVVTNYNFLVTSYGIGLPGHFCQTLEAVPKIPLIPLFSLSPPPSLGAVLPIAGDGLVFGWKVHESLREDVRFSVAKYLSTRSTSLSTVSGSPWLTHFCKVVGRDLRNLSMTIRCTIFGPDRVSGCSHFPGWVDKVMHL